MMHDPDQNQTQINDAAIIARHAAHSQPAGWRHMSDTDAQWPRCVTCDQAPVRVQLTRGQKVRLLRTCSDACRWALRSARARATVAARGDSDPGPSIVTRVCDCGTVYTHPRSLDVRHCSRKCAGKARALAISAKRAAESPEQHSRHGTKYACRHPERDLAHRRLRAAVRRGEVVPAATCSVCGGRPSGGLIAHHESYDPASWLDVTWLCRSCHARHHHAERRAESIPGPLDPS